MVDAAKRGWRNSNGLFKKVTVEKKILPVLNEKLVCQKTHPQYLSCYAYYLPVAYQQAKAEEKQERKKMI